jgi:D-aminoacyl-tRNA deacylase
VCGRFTSSQRREALAGRFEVAVPESYHERYNLAPQQRTLIVRELVGRQADTAKGNRPSFSAAAPPEEAEPLYEAFCAALRSLGIEVATGVFGARMQLELVNDGPVTIILGA